MQSSHFEFRITQTSVFLNFLIQVLDENLYFRVYKTARLAGQPPKDKKLWGLKLTPVLCFLRSISDDTENAK